MRLSAHLPMWLMEKVKAELEKLAADHSDKLKVLNVYDNPKTQVSDLQKGLLTIDRVAFLTHGYFLFR